MKGSMRSMKVGHSGWVILYDRNGDKDREISIYFPLYIDFDEKTIDMNKYRARSFVIC